MRRLVEEYRHFLSRPRDMRVLLMTNLIYALVLPVIDVFVGAYIMRNTEDPRQLMQYQMAVYAGIPLTFLINGFLLRHIHIKRLYSMGMLLSGLAMAVMMSSGGLEQRYVAWAGLLMGMSFGFFWANRDLLAIRTTTDDDRNYYYGLETFFYTNTYVFIPLAIGWFIDGTTRHGWMGGVPNRAYQVVTGVVFLLTIASSVVVHLGRFPSPTRTRFLYLRFHKLWYRMQLLAVLKGLMQGYIVTAPAMLVMQLVGKEGALGTLQAVGGVASAFLLYLIGRTTGPSQRIGIFSVGLVLFVLGGLANAALYNQAGVFLFMACLLMARPLHDIAYFPIQMKVIDTVSAIEGRSKFAYIFHQEFGFFVGRLGGCGLFLLLARVWGGEFALRYAILFVALVQLLSIPVARYVLRGCDAYGPPPTEGEIPASLEPVISVAVTR